jgi:GAF domain-containing protein
MQMQPGESTLAGVVEGLLARTKASRVTLRQDLPGDYAFPVTHEALAPGAVSLMEERTVDLRMQPVVAELTRGRQVVQDDCRATFDDPAFQRMLETYGGLSSQIVTPILRDGRLAAILSLHQLGSRRRWTAEEIETTTRAAQQIGDVLVDRSAGTP